MRKTGVCECGQWLAAHEDRYCTPEPHNTDVELVQNILAERFSGGIHRNLGRDWVQTGPEQVNIAELAAKIVDALT